MSDLDYHTLNDLVIFYNFVKSQTSSDLERVHVKNLDNYQEYLKNVTPIAKKYGGEYIVRAGKYEVMEGKWPSKRN